MEEKIMKKLASFLLAMAMVLGIGVCGTVGAGAFVWVDVLPWKEIAAIQWTYAPLQLYFGETSDISNERVTGLKQSIDPAYNAVWNSAEAVYDRYTLGYSYNNWDTTPDSILKAEVLEVSRLYQNGTMKRDVDLAAA